MVKYMLIALAAYLLASCASSTVTISARGTQATISLKNGQVYEAELLALQDSVLIVEWHSLMVIRQKDVRSVELQIEHERAAWIAQVATMEVLPSTAFVIRGASDGNSRLTIGIIGLVASAATVASFIASEPQDTFTWPLTADEIDDLRLHTRFPYGISSGQIAQIKAMRHPGQ